MSLLNNLIVRIRGDKTQLDQTLKGAEKSVSNFGGAVKKIGGVIAAAFSVAAIASFAKEAVKLAATTEGIQRGFRQIAEPGLLDDLRKATAGTVSDMKLMQTAVQASNFEIPLNKLAKLLEFASARAVQTGQSVEYLTESIILGIGRKSPLILDNLGISAVKLREVLKGSGVEMSNVGDIAEAVGKIAGESLEKMGGMAETAAVKMERLTTSWQNFKQRIGEKITESPAFTKLLDSLTQMLNLTEGKNYGTMARPQLLEEQNKLLSQRNDLDAQFTAWEEKDLKVKWYQSQKRKDQAIELTQIQNEYAKIKKELTEIDSILNAPVGKTGTVGGYVWTPISKRKVQSFTSFSGMVEPNKISQLKSIYGVSGEGALKQGPAAINEVTEALQWQEEVLAGLTAAFSDMFANVSGGFDDMIDSLVKSLQRYVQEVLARAAILALMNIIAPGSSMAVSAHKSLGSLIPLGTGLFGGKKSVASTSGPIEFKIHGKDLQTVLQRNG